MALNFTIYDVKCRDDWQIVSGEDISNSMTIWSIYHNDCLSKERIGEQVESRREDVQPAQAEPVVMVWEEYEYTADDGWI